VHRIAPAAPTAGADPATSAHTHKTVTNLPASSRGWKPCGSHRRHDRVRDPRPERPGGCSPPQIPAHSFGSAPPASPEKAAQPHFPRRRRPRRAPGRRSPVASPGKAPRV